MNENKIFWEVLQTIRSTLDTHSVEYRQVEYRQIGECAGYRIITAFLGSGETY